MREIYPNTRPLERFHEAGGVLWTSQAQKLGIHPRTLYRLRDAGELERLSRSVALSPVVKHHEIGYLPDSGLLVPGEAFTAGVEMNTVGGMAVERATVPRNRRQLFQAPEHARSRRGRRGARNRPRGSHVRPAKLLRFALCAGSSSSPRPTLRRCCEPISTSWLQLLNAGAGRGTATRKPAVDDAGWSLVSAPVGHG